MNNHEFADGLRARAAAVAPAITVDTSGIVRGARRRRAARRGAATLVALGLVAGTGWTAYARPWESPSGDAAVLPAGQPSESANAPTALSTASAQGKYWYVKSVSEVFGADGKPTIDPQTNEEWIGNDTPGVFIPNGDTSQVSDFGPARWGELTINGKDTLLTWSALGTLPTDPAALEKVMRESTYTSPDDPNPTPDMQVLTFAENLLEGSPASPALRNAVWTVLTRQPSATKPAPTTDALGRPGTAITVAGEGGDGTLATLTLVFDEKSNTLLEERYAGKAPGSTTDVTTYVDQHATDTIPIQPDLKRSGCVSWERC